MNSQQTVDTFLEFFRERGHHPIPGQLTGAPAR